MSQVDLEARRKYDREYRQRRHLQDPEFHRRKDLWKRYNITIEDFDKMYQDQGSKCKICRIDIPYRGNTIAVDHCHKTGKVRGILCVNCNIGIGHFSDDKDILQKAIDYLNDNG